MGLSGAGHRWRGLLSFIYWLSKQCFIFSFISVQKESFEVLRRLAQKRRVQVTHKKINASKKIATNMPRTCSRCDCQKTICLTRKPFENDCLYHKDSLQLLEYDPTHYYLTLLFKELVCLSKSNVKYRYHLRETHIT